MRKTQTRPKDKWLCCSFIPLVGGEWWSSSMMLRVCVALALYWTVVGPPTTLTSERLKQEDGGYECSSAINSFVGTMQRFSSWSLFCYFLLIDRSTQTKYCIKIKWNPGLFPVFVLIWCFVHSEGKPFSPLCFLHAGITSSPVHTWRLTLASSSTCSPSSQRGSSMWRGGRLPSRRSTTNPTPPCPTSWQNCGPLWVTQKEFRSWKWALVCLEFVCLCFDKSDRLCEGGSFR